VRTPLLPSIKTPIPTTDMAVANFFNAQKNFF
jgi:hypothetical protein